MKKIIFLLILLIPQSFVSAHARVDVESLDDFDITKISICQNDTLECQIQNAQLRDLVQALLVQVAERLTDQNVSDSAEVSESGNNTAWYLESEYVKELSKQPLTEGKRKAFRIRDGKVFGLDQESHAVYQEVWRLFSTITPERHLEEFDKLTFYYRERDSRAAYVEQRIESRNGREREEWELSVNLYYIEFETTRDYNAIVRLLAHESGHVLVLNEEQVDFFVDEDDCDNYYLEDFESCSRDTSYYTDFIEEYWDQDFLEWSQQYEKKYRRDQESADRELEEYYEENYYDFVTEYAATSPDEDIAESIMFFLTGDIPTGELDLFEEKIANFFDYEEMIEIRRKTQELLR